MADSLHEAGATELMSIPPRLLELRLAESRCAIDLEQVVRVLPLMALAPLPQGPCYVRGFFDLAGENVIVIDLAERLGIVRDAPYSLDIPVLLCRVNGRVAGVIVDEVEGVFDNRANVLQLRDRFDGRHPPFHGVIHGVGRNILWLNLEQVLAFDMGLYESELQADPSALLANAPVAEDMT